MPGVFVDLTSERFDRFFNLGDLFDKPSHQHSNEAAKPEQEPPAKESPTDLGLTDFFEASSGGASQRLLSNCPPNKPRSLTQEEHRGAPFQRRGPLEVGPKPHELQSEETRIHPQSSSFAHAVAAGAYSLAVKAAAAAAAAEDEQSMPRVAKAMRERSPPIRAWDVWDRPVRIYTQDLGVALGINWPKCAANSCNEAFPPATCPHSP